VRASSSAISAVPSALPSSTTMTSKSGVSSDAALTARITMLAMVPLSLYAGKKTLRPAGLGAGSAGIFMNDYRNSGGATLSRTRSLSPSGDSRSP
jgi:hypothetical protein